MHKAELNRLLQRDAAFTPQFAELCRLLDASLHFESTARLNQLKAAYEPLDPDAALPVCPDESPPQTGHAAADDLFEQFAELLDLCNYRRLPRSEIEGALHASSQWGVNLHVDFTMFRQLDCYVREEKVDHLVIARLWNLYRKETVEVPVYGRLAVIFELHPEAATTSEHVQPEQVYLKLFKNIPKADIDMLLPGAQVRMTLLDQGKIILPTVTGLGMTGLKLFKGAVIAAAFAGFYGLLGFLALVGAAIGYALKSFFGYQRTKEKYHLHLHRNLYYQNLANGRSVLFHLLDEAQEQEYQEATMAYFILWRGGEQLTAQQIDRAAESYLREQANHTTNFDVSGALAKLARLQLATCDEDRWQATPLDQAVAQLEHAWDNLFQQPQRS